MKRISLITLTAIFLSCCSSNEENKKKEEQKMETKDTVQTKQKQESEKPINPLRLFIDSMRKANFLIDTNRLKEVYAWSEAAKAPKEIVDGIVVIKLPFILESEKKHFTDPGTYFFARWNPEDATFKNGDDYLLMTWKIDSSAIKREAEIYNRITGFMGNFPAYCFRSEDRIYVIAHRMTVHCKQTKALTEKLRNYFDVKSKVFGTDYDCQ